LKSRCTIIPLLPAARTAVALLAVPLLTFLTPFAHADDNPFPPKVICEGDYSGHLQGVCTDLEDAIFWSFTTELVKTNLSGEIQKEVPVPNHHGDPCYRNGKVYVAVNLGNFNNPKGNADSWIYVYDPENLELLSKHNVPEVFHGAGGMDMRDGHFFIVGGLPKGVEENYVYEYDGDWKFVKKHTIASGWTNVGIQSAAFHDGAWWFGCYGTPRILLKTDANFKMLGRYEFDCALGIFGVAKNEFMVAKGPITPEKRHRGTLHRARPDEETGLAFLPETVSTRDKRIEREGNWQSAQFRFAATSHLYTKVEGAALSYSFEGTGAALRLGGHNVPAYGPANLGILAVTVDGGPEHLLLPRALPREVVLAKGLPAGEHTVRVDHRVEGDLAGCRVESFLSWSNPLGSLSFTVSGEENAFLVDVRAILRREGIIVRNALVRNWMTGHCALVGLPPGEGYSLEIQAMGWETHHSVPFSIGAGGVADLPPIYLQRDPATVIERFRFPRLNQPAIGTPGETFRARFLGFEAAIDSVRLVRQVGPATISRAVSFEEDVEAAYYYDREIVVTLPVDMPAGNYDLEVTVSGKGRDGVCRSPRSVHVVAKYTADPAFLTFGHLDTSGQYQAEYLARLAEIANLLAPDMVLCSTACNPAYISGALADLDMPYAINFGNHQFPGHEAWYGDPVGLIDYGQVLSILNYGPPWHEDRGRADALLASRADRPLKVINAFEPNAPVELFDRHGVQLIHDAHGPGERVQNIGATPTRRVGKVNSESFRLIRFADGRVASCTYRGHKNAPIPFPRATEPPLTLRYAKPNDGMHAENVATVRNTLVEAYPNGRVTFVMPAGDYQVTGGRLETSIASDDGRFVVVSVRVNIPASGAVEVAVKQET
jgi:hypothetical protein